jgi:hypothetical protein
MDGNSDPAIRFFGNCDFILKDFLSFYELQLFQKQ